MNVKMKVYFMLHDSWWSDFKVNAELGSVAVDSLSKKFWLVTHDHLVKRLLKYLYRCVSLWPKLFSSAYPGYKLNLDKMPKQ